MKIKVGIVGATGYMGGEVLRILLNHPQVEIAWASNRSGGNIEDYHPNLYDSGIRLVAAEDMAGLDQCDVVFLALPTDVSITMADKFLAMGSRVIDLGAAFRLSDQSTWERVYGQTHRHWHHVEQSVYGVNELHLEQIKQTRLVANPGCFASSAILALAPVIQHGLVDPQKLMVTGISGTAGVGAELSRAAHHPEIGNNLVPYNVVDHRHSYEMEQELGLLTPANNNSANSSANPNPVTVHFTPVYAPIVRGILSVCHVFPKEHITRQALLALYRTFYQQHEFVKVYDCAYEQAASWQYRPYPWVNAVSGSNYCFIGMDVDEQRNRVVLFSVLDSLGKGGAQVGVENMNLMLGIERSTGLKNRAMHPA